LELTTRLEIPFWWQSLHGFAGPMNFSGLKELSIKVAKNKRIVLFFNLKENEEKARLESALVL